MQHQVLVENADAWDILGGDLFRFGFIAEDTILENLASKRKTLDVARLLLNALGSERDNPVEAVRRLGLKKPSAQTSNDRLVLLRFLVTEFQLKKCCFQSRKQQLPELRYDLESISDSLGLKLEKSEDDLLRNCIRTIQEQGIDKWRCELLLSTFDISIQEVEATTGFMEFVSDSRREFWRRGEILFQRFDATLDAFISTPKKHRKTAGKHLLSTITQQRMRVRNLRPVSVYEAFASTTDSLDVVVSGKANQSHKSTPKSFLMGPVPDRGGRHSARTDASKT
ncbi:hypothetical protein NDN08_001589 [Rhodosorus marinus]|uniref:Uncharacterized protein n=1 Tax=Rhodosorus marinus TaxID=101924 RepID=A0AAV8UVD2_9RHOD|nr:hypothetical protein NDN08_001589 [Rhodosorus marinus]